MRKKVFVRKDGRKNLVIFSLVLFVAVVIVAVISLLPGRAPSLGNTKSNGVARSFLFPMVFTSANGSLQILSESYVVTEIDDTVSSAQHDIEKELVYYLREGALYEYRIAKNQRRRLVTDVVSYKVFPDRSSIVCVEEDSTIKLYQYGEKECQILSDDSPKREDVPALIVMGEEGVLFLSHYQQKGSQPTADLMLANSRGQVQKLASQINVNKSFYFGTGDRTIAYYMGNDLILADNKGKVLHSFPYGQLVQSQLQPQAVVPSTAVNTYSENLPLNTFLSYVSQTGQRNRLVYFDGKQEKVLAKDVQKLIFYSAERNTVWYTLQSETDPERVAVYQAVQGRSPQFLLECEKTAKFLLSGDLGHLYFQQEEGMLYRYSLVGRKNQGVLIEKNTGNLFVYANKPYMVFQDKDQEFQYIVLENNRVERFENNEVRLYGRHQNQYLLCRANQAGQLTLDYVEDDSYTRISGNIQQPVLFDKDFEHILFLSEQVLYVWDSGEIIELGEYIGLSSVPMIH